MASDQVREFLLTAPAHTAKLATVRADGRPHVAPVWYDLDGADLVFATGAGTVKGRNLTRDPRVAVSVDDERPPFTFVTIEGIAEVSEDLDDLLEWCTRIGGRYMGAAAAEAFGRRNAVPGELLVRVRATHVTAIKDLAD
jgi:PPOX class probable F420-dependent enzyme